MYGDKSQRERLDIIGPKGQTIPNAKINLNYYVTKEQFQDLLYKQKLTYKQIADKIDFPYDISNFSRVVRSLGWKEGKGSVRQFKSNSNFFDTFSRKSAWLYGWIITDGYVNEKYVDLTLQTTDVDVLQKFKRAVNFNGNLYKREGHSTIRIYNRGMVKSLQSLGIPTTNKTFDCVFPNIPKEYGWDFIRGAFEGDGSITHTKKGGLAVSMCGASKSFMHSFSDFLTNHGVENTIREARPEFYVISAKGMGNALRWLYFMY